MNKCIYLKNSEDKLTFTAEEHIIPAGIGGITKLKLGMVSDEFNTKIFSPIELDFMRNSVISLPRQFQGPGKRGSLSKVKATKSNIYLVSKDGTYHDAGLGYIKLGKPYLIPQVKITDRREVQVVFDRSDGEYGQQIAILGKELKTFQNKYTKILDNHLPLSDIILGICDGKWYLATHSARSDYPVIEVIPKIYDQIITMDLQPSYDSAQVNCHQQPTFNMDYYFRVCGKAVFNFLAYSKGADFVLNNCFDPIRNWIVKGGENKYVQMINPKETPSRLFEDIPFPENSHWIVINKTRTSLIGVVCFYGHFRHIVMLCDEFKSKYTFDGLVCDWENRKEYKLLDYINSMCE